MAPDEDSRPISVRYVHPDRNHRGREWLTEVGVEKLGSTAVCSVLLHTRDASAGIVAHTETTRPTVVRDIFTRTTITSDTPGGVPRPLTEADVDALDYVIHDADRNYPIVQVSPCVTGGYLLNPDRLADLLAGIGEVAVIPEGANTFAISDTLGSRFSAYHGAVNIIWPVVDRHGEAFVPSSRLLATDLEDSIAQGRYPENDILARVCHQTNAAIARQHLSPEKVQSRLLRAALDARRTESKGEADLKTLCDTIDKEQREEIERLSAELDESERQVTAEKSARTAAEATIQGLKAQLQRASSAAPASAGLSHADREVIVEVLLGTADLEKYLKAVEILFPGRLVVLDSARTSARKAREFQEPGRAFELLLKLCTTYYDALVDGKGDAAGKSIFGKSSFAARESETVESNKRAHDLRCFSYNGESIPMMRHLKIGNKDSKSTTFRAHFHWDATARRIVIGHCGTHLDHS